MAPESDGTPRINMIIGIFSSATSVEHAIDQLTANGVSADEISVISSNAAVKKHFQGYRPEAEPADWQEAAAVGGSTGAVLAGLTSVAALATGAGIPLVVAGGLASFLTGGVVGGLAGVMAERGVETEAADYYELAVSDGKTLVAVDLSGGHDIAAKQEQVERTLAAAGSEPVRIRKNPDFAS